MEVALETSKGVQFLPLAVAGNGYFEAVHPARAGSRYRYRTDGGESYPDPASRFQPDGPHGSSEVVDPAAFRWSDAAWRGLSRRGQVLYELHVGAFSEEGTYAGVVQRLAELKELGVTALELMPLNTFPGRFNWGYDGVGLFAPCAVYGRPDDLRKLIDAAHALGMGVLLDVVYNHLGPDGNYLGKFSAAYFTDRYPHEWGEPPNLDGEDSGPVRGFFVENAARWISEYHFDGLRIDATQNLFDASERNILAELSVQTRKAAAGRDLLLIAENEPQDFRCVEPLSRGGYGLDQLWVDDFHHSARVAMTGRAEAYFQDYRGTARELLACALRNSLYQGQYYAWQKKARGTPLRRLGAEQVVFFLQNHDQVANALRGERMSLLAAPSKVRALTVFSLLLPQTPLLFMGQEGGARTPFHFFSDAQGPLAEVVRKGREHALSRFPSARAAIEREGFRISTGEDAFLASKLRASDVDPGMLALHKTLLRLRREDPCFAAQDLSRLEGAVLGEDALLLRYLGDDGDRLLVLNLGAELRLAPSPEPLLAPSPGMAWEAVLSSEDARFGGMGGDLPDVDGPWALPGHVALVFKERPRRTP